MDQPLPNRLRHASKILSLSMLIMGVCGIIYEYNLGVLGNNLMGSSYEQIFVVIGIMMFAMGIGAVLQRRVVGHLVDRFIAIEFALGFLGGIATVVVYAAFVETLSYSVVLFSFAFAIGVLIGLEIPLAIRINTEFSKSLPVNLSNILAMDYVGSLLGAILFAYVLLAHVSIARIGVALGIVNTLLGLLILVFFWPLVRRKRLLSVACILSLATLGGSFSYIDGWMGQLEQRCFEDPIVYRETTKYQHLILTDRDEVLKLYINGHLQFSSKDEAIYHELLVHVPMALAPHRERVLILGGGDGLALREVLKYGDVKSVTLVDIDPAVTRLASSQADLIRLNQAAFHDARVCVLAAEGVAPGERVTVTQSTKIASQLLDDREYELADISVFNVDADRFVREIGEDYDVVIVDFPDPKTVEVAKLFSVEFYRSLAKKLAPGALCSIQASSPYGARKVFLCIGKSLRTAGLTALPYHDTVPSFGDWGWYLAWSGEPEPEAMRARLRAVDRIPAPTTYLTPKVVAAAFVFGKSSLAEMDELQANTRMRPAVVRYYREAWQ